MKYRVNKEKCIGCGICWAVCPEGAVLDEADNKAKITDSEKMDKCGGESICPYSAIEKEE